MYLGLDLRGGVHFLMQVDMKGALDKAHGRGYQRYPQRLCANRTFAYSGVSRDGNVVTVKFRDADARSKGEAEIKQQFSGLCLERQG